VISLALASTLASAPGAHAYRVSVSGPRGSSIVVAAQPPPGWTATFCNPRVCAVGHAPVAIGASGTADLELHLYPAAHPSNGDVLVTAQGATLRIAVIGS
jgi:hypothetical protein